MFLPPASGLFCLALRGKFGQTAQLQNLRFVKSLAVKQKVQVVLTFAD